MSCLVDARGGDIGQCGAHPATVLYSAVERSLRIVFSVSASAWTPRFLECPCEIIHVVVCIFLFALPLPRLCDDDRSFSVEVGCGTGDVILSLASDFQHSLGIDINDGFLAYAQEQTPKELKDKVCVRGVGDLRHCRYK